MRNTKYTIQLGKGCGLIEETLQLLSICEENTTKESLATYVREHNSLSKSTDKRSMDIVKLVFYPRYLKRNPKVAFWLKTIRGRGLMLPQFKQLLMLYCARENAVMYDYVTKHLNTFRESNIARIPADNIQNYIKQIVESGQAQWGESIQKRSSSYVKAVLVDFDFISKRSEILPYEIADFTVLYLMHELHFAGLSDLAIWNHGDRQLFGLDKYKVQQHIMELSIKGGYIAQCSGELMTISWNYQSMEEFINETL
ncbi:MAG: DUF1819 family protein [Lentisphaerae bacterium]|nr:DUF1819 family protein [Lentisphaerota bacterium]